MARSKPSHLVAIGASAGGVEAIQNFFKMMPTDSGMAFVVVQHLSPDFKSLMAEITSRHTNMKVSRVEEEMRLEQNSVYLIPAGKQMEITSQKGFHLTERSTSASPEKTISIFFESVARSWGKNSIGVILSGSGSDGSMGLAEIYDAGGLTMVQDPDEAAFNAMPRAAIETGKVDLIRFSGDMVDAIELFSSDPKAAKKLDQSPLVSQGKGLARIYQLLKKHSGINFDDYKPNMVNRRIQRRIELNKLDSLDDFANLLLHNEIELDVLANDLLISVTDFFRDPESFETVGSKAIEPLIENLDPLDELRIWVAGCATGEEVYSFAMMIDEVFQSTTAEGRWKIFATDAHQASLDFASRGVYDADKVNSVSQQRLERYFTRSGNSYQVNKSLRENVVFAYHNLLRDPPFTKMHLISCRNLLIYFSNDAQQRILEMMSFALRSQGFLFLGASESLRETQKEFASINKKVRLFQKVHSDYYPLSMPRHEPFRTFEKDNKPARPSGDLHLLRGLERLLEIHVDSGILINEHGEILYCLGETRNFLKPPLGIMSNRLSEMLPERLRVTVMGAVNHAKRQQKSLSFKSEYVDNNGKLCPVEMQVSPLSISDDDDSQSIFVAIKVIEESPETDTSVQISNDEFASSQVHELEKELKLSREGMQNVVEELETSNEELQSTNEEMIASNEELQSTNEELQSVNEELYTVNTEFDTKNRELAELNSDLDNLLQSTRIGVIFLDETLKIRKFTPAVAEAIHLLETDVGRPLSHITNNLDIDPESFVEMAELVMVEKEPIEREIATKSGFWYLMRLLPFIDPEGDKKGVVISLIDINQTKDAQNELDLEAKRQITIADAIDTMVWLHLNTEGHCVERQIYWEKHLGQKWPKYRKFGWLSRVHDDDRKQVTDNFKKQLSKEKKFEIHDIRVRYREQDEFYLSSMSFWPVVNANKCVGWVALLEDFHEKEATKAELTHHKTVLDSIINHSSAAISVKDNQKEYILINQYMCELLGIDSPTDAIGQKLSDLTDPDIAEVIGQHDESILNHGRNCSFEAFIDPNNPDTPFNITKFPLRSPSGAIEGVVGIATDLRDRERQNQLKAQTDELSRVNRELAMRNEELDDYAHIISHDLKQPLRTIYTLTEMLDEEIGDSVQGDGADFLYRISRASRKLRLMVDGILEYSRSGRDELDMSMYSSKDIIAEVIENLQSDIESLNADISIASDLPDVLVDRTLLYQIFQNLIGNAIKFTAKSNPKIWISAISKGMFWEFNIEDNGIGIDPEFKTLIFKPFERLHTPDEYPGTGIGLAIAARLVSRHGGSIRVETRGKESGTSFKFTLPFAKDET